MDILSKRLEFGDRALSEIVAAMPLIRFDPDARHHLYAATLHTTIVQLCGGCLALARTEHTAGVPVLLRSIYEALVDLDNLVHDATYSERMEAANLKQILKPLDRAAVNPLLAGVEKKHDIPALVAEWRRELQMLKAKGKGPLDIKTRCENVGRSDEYDSVYALYCLDAHNNVAALVDRHISSDASQAVQVSAFGDGNAEGLANRLYSAIGWMLTSAQYVHGAFKTGCARVAELQREHESLR